ncbi:M1 family metallopeptidase [Solimonas marina]|uniref:Aminopeptidase N n=1 Tax=Solimonas marina TaxID=2714601 RepID=A0A969W662_9GAMM|nr:M1 family metallopeptidase [Solimonas marina]NKF21132.1 M1 family metallopeptidase [Solimonas marina]
MFRSRFPSLLALAGSLLLSPMGYAMSSIEPAAQRSDPHSYANVEDFRTRDVALDLQVDFPDRVLRGTATLTLDRLKPAADTLILDTRDLDIASVEAGHGDTFKATTFKLAPRDPVLGSALLIAMPESADRVRIRYATEPQASGLQWLTPMQTAGKKHPFLFSQSESIHARSWIPLQDTPQVRQTYSAHITTPKGLRAVMSADNDPKAPANGDYRFKMPQRIPSYLIALAVGDLDFRATGPRTGVYADPTVVAAAAHEFEDTEQMLETCERLYGPYRWGRYDLLILPPSFPFGGMENPRLTFASPTVIAGDKSLVSLVAHEMAHSWSGNLVTNATWSDIWLNEGFTDHATFRVVEEVYGKDAAQQERVLSAENLKDALAADGRDDDKTLQPDLVGRDPDDGLSDVPYARGALFLAYLDAKFGRPTMDAFLNGWFNDHAFQSVRTATFVRYLHDHLLVKHPGVVSDAEVHAWIYDPKLPADAVWPSSDAFAHVDTQRQAWLSGSRKANALDTQGWTTHQWQYFLRTLPALSTAQIAELDQAFGLSKTHNQIIAGAWWKLTTANHYAPAAAGTEQYLGEVGRMLLIEPIYEEMVKTADGRQRAQAIFAEWKDRYHPIAQDAIAKIVNGKT